MVFFGYGKPLFGVGIRRFRLRLMIIRLHRKPESLVFRWLMVSVSLMGKGENVSKETDKPELQEMFQFLGGLTNEELDGFRRHRPEILDLIRVLNIESRAYNWFVPLSQEEAAMLLIGQARPSIGKLKAREEVAKFFAAYRNAVKGYKSVFAWRVFPGWHFLQQWGNYTTWNHEAFRELSRRHHQYAQWPATPSAIVFWAPVAYDFDGQWRQADLPKLGNLSFQTPSASLLTGLCQTHLTRTGYRWPAERWCATSDSDGMSGTLCLKFENRLLDVKMCDLHPLGREHYVVQESPVLIVPIVGG